MDSNALLFTVIFLTTVIFVNCKKKEIIYLMKYHEQNAYAFKKEKMEITGLFTLENIHKNVKESTKKALNKLQYFTEP